jgi:hypothetical protein
MKLELRHQRSHDTVFDFYDQKNDPLYTPKHVIYPLIETLLPKANYHPDKKLKMLEL